MRHRAPVGAGEDPNEREQLPAVGGRDVEERSVTLDFDDFGHRALEEQSRRFELSRDDFLRLATLHFLTDLESERAATRVPSFRRGPEQEGGLTLALELEISAWRSLEEEAARQRVRLERLLEHAVLYFIADIDAGRVTLRILKSIEEAEEAEDEG